MTFSVIRAAALAAAATLGAAPVAIGAAPAQRAAQATPLTFAAIEQRAIALGVRPSELKIKARTAEIEGRDASGRKVEMTLDRTTGELLHRDFDD